MNAYDEQVSLISVFFSFSVEGRRLPHLRFQGARVLFKLMERPLRKILTSSSLVEMKWFSIRPGNMLMYPFMPRLF